MNPFDPPKTFTRTKRRTRWLEVVEIILALVGIVALPVIAALALEIPVWELLANGLRFLFH